MEEKKVYEILRQYSEENDRLSAEDIKGLAGLLADESKYPIEETLGDVVVIVTALRETDGDLPMPVTYVYRYDFAEPTEENIAKFIECLEDSEAIVEGGQMKNE